MNFWKPSSSALSSVTLLSTAVWGLWVLLFLWDRKLRLGGMTEWTSVLKSQLWAAEGHLPACDPHLSSLHSPRAGFTPGLSTALLTCNVIISLTVLEHLWHLLGSKQTETPTALWNGYCFCDIRTGIFQALELKGVLYPSLPTAVKRVEQETVTLENLMSVLHKISRTFWVAVNHGACFSLLSLIPLAENFLQMATKMLSPMVVNFPGLCYSRSENERIKHSRNVTFLAESKALTLFGGGGGYKIAEIHAYTSV